LKKKIAFSLQKNLVNNNSPVFYGRQMTMQQQINNSRLKGNGVMFVQETPALHLTQALKRRMPAA
jgi:hypothetical protein